MKRCKLCVIPDTRPDTAFVDGICSACLAYKNRPFIDWGLREQQLRDLVARAREVGKQNALPYDCIVPSSGGKDSHYQVLKLQELGLRVLVVTATTCHPTPIGRANVENLARYATTIEYTPNKAVRAKLNRLGLTMVGDISWPEHVAIFTIPFLIAKRTGIPFLFYGENPQNQYGGPLESQDAQTMTRRWVSEFGGFLGLRPSDLIGVEGLTKDDLADYMPVDAQGIEAHFLGQYIPWDSHRNASVAKAHGMIHRHPGRGSWWEHENLDNAQTGLHDHFCYRKYGYGRLAAQISVDIRRGIVSDRQRALDIVHIDDGRFPYEYAGVHLDDVLKHIRMTKTQLYDVMDKFTNWDIFSRTDFHSDGVPYLLEEC